MTSDSCCGRCCSRVPWATVFAIVLNLAGMAIFTTALFYMLESIETIFNMNLYAKYVVIGIWVLMAVIDLWFLGVAIPYTGQTRLSSFKTRVSKCCGRFCITTNMMFAFLLNLAWIIFSCALVVIVVVVFMARMLCGAAKKLSADVCKVLTELQAVQYDTTTSTCTAKSFCGPVKDVSTYTILAFVGSLIICVSMIVFIMTMSANFVHLEHRIQENNNSDEKYRANENGRQENGMEMAQI